MKIAAKIGNYISSIKFDIRSAFVDNDDGNAINRRRIFVGGIFGSLASILMNGVFFTALLLILLDGESESIKNAWFGTILSIQTACGTVQILSPLITERLKYRKKFVMTLRLIQYAFNVLLAFIPLLPAAPDVKIGIFIGFVLVINLATSLHGPAIGIWHWGDLLGEKRTDYFTLYNMAMPIVTTVFTIVCSAFVDRFKANGAELTAILILRAIAVIMIFEESVQYFKADEPENKISGERFRPLKILLTPFQYPKFMTAVLIISLWSFTTQIQGSYFTLYLLEEMGLSYTFINFFSIFNIPILILILPFWNRVIKKLGWLPALSLTMLLYALPQLMNLFITPATVWIYPVACIYTMFVSPGLSIAVTNLPYISMPAEGKTSCLAFYATASSLAGLLGVVFGKYYVQATEGRYLRIGSFAISNRLSHFLLSGVMIVLIALTVFAVNRKFSAAPGQPNSTPQKPAGEDQAQPSPAEITK